MSHRTYLSLKILSYGTSTPRQGSRCKPVQSLVTSVSLDVCLLLPGEDKESSSYMKLLQTLSVAH